MGEGGGRLPATDVTGGVCGPAGSRGTRLPTRTPGGWRRSDPALGMMSPARGCHGAGPPFLPGPPPRGKPVRDRAAGAGRPGARVISCVKRKLHRSGVTQRRSPSRARHTELRARQPCGSPGAIPAAGPEGRAEPDGAVASAGHAAAPGPGRCGSRGARR